MNEQFIYIITCRLLTRAYKEEPKHTENSRFMARKQATSLSEIANTAVSYITRNGFKQTQMAGLAKEIGVSAGTLYTYVENKDALLNLATTYLLREEDLPDLELPVRAVPADAIIEQFIETAAKWAQWPVLKKAIAETDTSQDTLRAVGRELYGLIRKYWRSILLLDRLANERADFAPVHTDQVRGGLVGDLVILLQKAGSPFDVFELGIIARAANEGVSWSAMHRHFEGEARQPVGDLTEDEICTLSSRTFAAALAAALPERIDQT
jgi:AcrR family transcriptional regulator